MRAILRRFTDNLDNTRDNIHLVEQLKALASLPAVPTAQRTRIGRAALETRRRVLKDRTWETISLDGSLLFLAAQYEMTARDFAGQLITGMCQKVRRYAQLPDSVRDENRRLVGELLRNPNDPRRSAVDYVAVLDELLHCERKGTPVQVYTVGFSFHERNLSHRELADLYRRAGVKNFWPRVAEDPNLQTYFDALRVPKAVQPLSENKLDSFIRERNEISHRGPSYQAVGASVLLEYVEFFRNLMAAVCSVLEDHLNSFPSAT